MKYPWPHPALLWWGKGNAVHIRHQHQQHQALHSDERMGRDGQPPGPESFAASSSQTGADPVLEAAACTFLQPLGQLLSRMDPVGAGSLQACWGDSVGWRWALCCGRHCSPCSAAAPLPDFQSALGSQDRTGYVMCSSACWAHLHLAFFSSLKLGSFRTRLQLARFLLGLAAINLGNSFCI